MATMVLTYFVSDHLALSYVVLPRDATVEALQKPIYKEQRYKRHFVFQACDLKLYVAKNNIMYLKDYATLKMLNDESDPVNPAMNPTARLDDETIFGKDFEPSRGQIDVLVRHPPNLQTRKEWINQRQCQDDVVRVVEFIAWSYDFDCTPRQPHIGEILTARDNNTWKYQVFEVGEAMFNDSMPHFFDKDEWKVLRQFDAPATSRVETVYDGSLQTLYSYGPFSDEQIQMIKKMLIKIQSPYYCW